MNWICPVCATANPASVSRCMVCDTERGKKPMPAPPDAGKPSGPFGYQGIGETADADTSRKDDVTVKETKKETRDSVPSVLLGDKLPDIGKGDEWLIPDAAADAGAKRSSAWGIDAYTEGVRFLRRHDYAGAFRKFTEASPSDPRAMLELGQCYYFGRGTAVDLPAAFACYKEAAGHGDPAGLFSLGYCYCHGEGTDTDTEKGIAYLMKAADAGYPCALNELGDCCYYGRGFARDHTRAVGYYRAAAEADDARGLCNFGYCLSNGQGIDADPAEAYRYYHRAERRGNRRATIGVADCYAGGFGVSPDPKRAVELYRVRAEEDFPDAQYRLGCCYETGRGVPRSRERAAYWFRRAAEKGIIGASEALKRVVEG